MSILADRKGNEKFSLVTELRYCRIRKTANVVERGRLIGGKDSTCSQVPSHKAAEFGLMINVICYRQRMTESSDWHPER